VAEGDRFVFISGQTVRDDEVEIIGVVDMKKRAAKAIENLRVAVESVGGSMADTAKVTNCVVNLQPDDRLWIGKMFRNRFPKPRGANADRYFCAGCSRVTGGDRKDCAS
jgi:enamine deaminase RidA (YjgF/YER057c/UK114 family)